MTHGEVDSSSIFHLDTIWRYQLHATAVYLCRNPLTAPMTVQQKAGWSSEAVCALWRTQESSLGWEPNSSCCTHGVYRLLQKDLTGALHVIRALKRHKEYAIQTENELQLPVFMLHDKPWNTDNYSADKRRKHKVQMVIKKLHGLSPRANYTDRATAACRRSDCQLLRIEGCNVVSVTDPYSRILGFLDMSRYFFIK
jgi:hypothetical protein